MGTYSRSRHSPCQGAEDLCCQSGDLQAQIQAGSAFQSISFISSSIKGCPLVVEGADEQANRNQSRCWMSIKDTCWTHFETGEVTLERKVCGKSWLG